MSKRNYLPLLDESENISQNMVDTKSDHHFEFKGKTITLSRRTFMKWFGAGCAAAMVEGCTIADRFDNPPLNEDIVLDLNDPQYQALTAVYSDGQASNPGYLALNINGLKLLIIRVSESDFFISTRTCAHNNADLDLSKSGRWDSATGTLTCDDHKSKFRKGQGIVSGPVTQNLTYYEYTFDATANQLTILKQGMDQSMGGTPAGSQGGAQTSDDRKTQILSLTGDATRGKTVYEDTYCGSCHGDDLKGYDQNPGLLGSNLLSELEDGEDFVETLLEGISGTAMGSYYNLPDQDIADMLAYAKSLK
jgi:mono/diheme cytochrome c family protein